MKVRGFFNYTEISSIYQYIRQFDDPSIPLGALSDSYYEHFLVWITGLMELYQNKED